MGENETPIGGTAVNTPPDVEKTVGHEPTDQGDGGGNEPTGETENESDR